ncbi:MAG: glucose 1-dehydrogenase [Hyphomicrobiales bacterium]|nr:glucose 1-dehydrogenase [Hyphomicrobiales bacterium]
MSNRVAGKVALVTGAASGIGFAVAFMLAREGARVVATDIDEEAAKKVAAGIEGEGAEALGLRLDVAREEDWRTAMDETMKRFGRLDVLVNNAGVALAKSVLETSLNEWRGIMSINLDGVFLGTRYGIEAMAPGGGGSIVNMSSVYGMVGGLGVAAYCASKGGVRVFTKAAALECAELNNNVRVNSVHPGFIETSMVNDVIRESANPEALRKGIEYQMALKRMGEPSDVAAAVLYLASDESRFCTGSELVVDGGMLAR